MTRSTCTPTPRSPTGPTPRRSWWRKAAQAGLDVVALTDHDTFDGLDEAVAEGERIGVEVVPRAGAVLLRGRAAACTCWRTGRIRRTRRWPRSWSRVRAAGPGRLDRCWTSWPSSGVPVSEEEVLARSGTARRWVGRTSPTRWSPPATSGTARRRSTGSWPTAARRTCRGTRSTSSRGIDLVHGAGGVAVIAHPWGRGREQLLPPAVLAELVAEHGLDGIEVDHQDHDADARRRLRQLADRLGRAGHRSSDYHGTGKVDHDLGVQHHRPGDVRQAARPDGGHACRCAGR